MEDRSPQLLGAGIAFVALAWITFCLRIYVRGLLLRTWGIDDWLMTCAVASFTVYVICQTAGIAYGTGKHLADLEPDRAQTALIYWWLCELFYIPSTIFLKLSVGVFLHRIAVNKWHIWTVRLMMVFSGLFGTAYLLLAIFQCKPISSWWIRKHSPLQKDYGWCFTNDVVVGVTFASSGLNSIADWTFGILPFFIVKDLHMAPRSKKLVACILGFANIACVATIVRMPFILDLYHDDDFLFETIEIALWSNVEAGIGIAAACIATLRPLLRKVFGRRASAWFPDRSRSPAKKHYRDAEELTTSGRKSYVLERSIHLRPDRSDHYTEISSGSRRERSQEKRDFDITGKELKDLYNDVDGEREQEMSLSAAAQDPAFATPGRERARTPALEIRKSIEFTFTVEEASDVRAQDQEITRSVTPVNWPIVTPMMTTGRTSPLPPVAMDGDGTPESPDSITFPSPPKQPKTQPPAEVGDPFGAWRSYRGI